MYLWQRHATGPWLKTNERELEKIAPGAVAIIKRADRKRRLVQVACKTRAQASRLTKQFHGRAERLSRDWQKSFLQHEAPPPIRIGRRSLVIPAAGAFGTGEHATTAMCLRLLEETTRQWPPGWRMLDAGTGTGILALAACCFGAREVLGIDNDPRAVAHARENARRNRIRGAKFRVCDLFAWKQRNRYDLIVANLFSEILIAALPLFRRALRQRGRIILSGILSEQTKPVVRAVRRSGFEIEQLRRRGKWVALVSASSRKISSRRSPRSSTGSSAPANSTRALRAIGFQPRASHRP